VLKKNRLIIKKKVCNEYTQLHIYKYISTYSKKNKHAGTYIKYDYILFYLSTNIAFYNAEIIENSFIY